MADLQKGGLAERDIDQAITALKKGAYLLKYGRRGKPKFCPFQLSSDESKLIWYSGKEEKHIKLSHVSRIIPGQRTAIFQRYPRPEKEYQSFSLIYIDRSLDLICKDKDEAEIWFAGLKALISGGTSRKWRIEARSDFGSIDSPLARNRKFSVFDPGDAPGIQAPYEAQCRLGKAFSDIITQTALSKSASQPDLVDLALASPGPVTPEYSNSRTSGADAIRVSLSSAVSSSSHGSCNEDFDALGDVFIWGQGVGEGVLGGGVHKVGAPLNSKIDALLPKALESTVALDVYNIACGGRHAVLVTKQGEIFSWGEESGGRLGHGMGADVPQPKLIVTLSGMNFESIACGEYHTCAVTVSGDLFTWGDGTHNSGLLGHGSESSHWIPKKVSSMEGIHVSYISCGPWHTALVTSDGQLFTFGDGSFGALGHGDHSSTTIPREVGTLSGLRTTRVACGVWHTAAVVEVVTESSDSGSPGSCTSAKLFTWGDGDKGQLGHGDKESRLFPESVASLVDENICRVACGDNFTVALTASGRVYTMGSSAYGQLGTPTADSKVPSRVEGKIADSFVEEIACGSYHVAILTSKTEVYTWGKGTNGQLGHGDMDDRNTPTLVDFLKDKQVKSVACGSNFTAIICLHKWVSSADQSMCSGCRNPFGFRRKRHNCYNCGLVFCKVCTSKKSMKASLAPTTNKPYRVCDECFAKLRKAAESGSAVRTPKAGNGPLARKYSEMIDREAFAPRLQTQLSRVSSVDSSNQAESRNFKQELKLQLPSRSLFPTQNGNFQPGGFYSPKLSISQGGDAKKILAASLAGSRKTSRAASPVSGMSSPNRSSAVTLDDSKQMNDSLNQEIINLRAQVEDLTLKSQQLETELSKTSRQLQQVSAIAENEAEKCKSAKEVIKTLTAQLKEVADLLPAGQNAHSNSSSIGKHIPNVESPFSNDGYASMMPTGNEVNGNSESISHGTKGQTEKSEMVMQVEPGVYITLSCLPNGSNELKRVRFSRKHFTEEQAEKWWAENGVKVCERQNIVNAS